MNRIFLNNNYLFSSNSSHGTAAGSSYKWKISDDTLRIFNFKGYIVYTITVSDIININKSFDYCLPTRFVDVNFYMTNDDVYFNFKALLSFENASLDPSNPVELVVALGKEKHASVPVYISDIPDAIAKMRFFFNFFNFFFVYDYFIF